MRQNTAIFPLIKSTWKAMENNLPGALIDAGWIVALLDKNDVNHELARLITPEFQIPFKTCEAVVSEACFLMARIHPGGPADVLSMACAGFFETAFTLKGQEEFIRVFMQKYRDQHISLADACLVRLAEIHNEPRILTFDSDFEVYRWGKNRKFVVMNKSSSTSL